MSAVRSESRPGRADDLPAVVALLAECGLPTGDLSASHLDAFRLVLADVRLVGVGGVEPAGDAGLLRSVAVLPGFRRRGLARQLVADCEATAVERGIATLYLIPNDAAAEAVFTRCGYCRVERTGVPDALRRLPEFTHLCPQSHPCLRKSLVPGA